MKKICRIAVFCSGFGSNFQAMIGAVKNKKLTAQIALMVCDNPKAYAITRANKASIPVVVLSPKLFASREEFERIIVGILKNQQVDVIVLAGFMRILTPYFIKAYRGKILNIHPSYLPAFKGAHAIRDAYEAKVPFTGVSIHLVTEKLDSGKVLLQEKIKISPKESIQNLEKRIHQLEHKLYPQAVQSFIKTKG